MRRDRRPECIEHSHDCRRLRVLHLHFDTSELEYCKLAFEDEATRNGVRKAANGLHLGMPAILPTVVHNQLQRDSGAIEGGHNRLDPLQYLFLCIAHEPYPPKGTQNCWGGRTQKHIEVDQSLRQRNLLLARNTQ
jgi:hypothetical protein